MEHNTCGGPPLPEQGLRMMVLRSISLGSGCLWAAEVLPNVMCNVTTDGVSSMGTLSSQPSMAPMEMTCPTFVSPLCSNFHLLFSYLPSVGFHSLISFYHMPAWRNRSPELTLRLCSCPSFLPSPLQLCYNIKTSSCPSQADTPTLIDNLLNHVKAPLLLKAHSN